MVLHMVALILSTEGYVPCMEYCVSTGHRAHSNRSRNFIVMRAMEPWSTDYPSAQGPRALRRQKRTGRFAESLSSLRFASFVIGNSPATGACVLSRGTE